MKNQLKDRYSQAFLIILIGMFVLIFLHFKYSKTTGFLFIIIGAIYGLVLTLSKSCILENEYQGKGFYKCENDCLVMELQLKQKVCGIDGIKTNGKVYKTANGTDIVITASGKIKPAGFGSALINSFNNKPLDSNWKPLIEAS